MDNIKLYEVKPQYIDYLTAFAPHLFHNKVPGQSNERKYIGVILAVNGMDYFAPLSSFKPKHAKMPEAVDFLKIKVTIQSCRRRLPQSGLSASQLPLRGSL